ncbi:hypothetical protein JHL18_16605 [Clostridium sp. YIM B02505]|uniref:Uncharacterized protein n=1 Tax=Clostridium yunnanense TaxID=2800325 RepID=A0ABS1ESA9_9CLOT|nr:hypothetical protein [Clostridium yunnanense]MBK1812245.1 hypothetical protein [Clostridium yunnanense]
MKVVLRILAMILLVVPAQHLIRGIIPGILGHGYKLGIFGLSNIIVIVISIILILISLWLFHITESFFDNGKK